MQTKLRRLKPEGDYWIIEGDAYDLTPFVQHHPGGAAFLTRSRNRDITIAVNTYHPDPEKLKPILEKYRHHRATSEDVDKDLNLVPTFLFQPGFDPRKEGHIPSYGFSNPDHILPKMRKILLTPEWRKKIAWADFLYDVTTALLLVLYAYLQWLCISRRLNWIVFALSMVAIRLSLAGAGHYSLHRAFKWPNVAINNLFDLGYVGFALTAWDGHTLIHHQYTMSGCDVKKGFFGPIMTLPRLVRIPVHTMARFGQFVCGIFIRGYIVNSSWVKLHLIPPDSAMAIYLPFWIVRTLLVGEMVVFFSAGLWYAWLLQYTITLWISTFQVVNGHDFDEDRSKPDFTVGQDWAAFQVKNACDTSYTGNVWFDCWLSAGLGSHRIHHVLPYQRSGYANIVSESILKRCAQENGIEWLPTENFFMDNLPDLLRKYFFGIAKHPGATNFWTEHFSISALKACAWHIASGFMGEGSI